MKEDHMMMLATRLYNDDGYDGYEIIYLVLLYCIVSLSLARMISMTFRPQSHDPYMSSTAPRGRLGDWLASMLPAYRISRCHFSQQHQEVATVRATVDVTYRGN